MLAAFLSRQREPGVIYAPKHGAILRRVAPSVPVTAHGGPITIQMDVDAEFSFHVALDQGEMTQPESIITTLNNLTGAVKDVVKVFIAARAIR